MNLANKAVYPVRGGAAVVNVGLNLREYYAGLAMQGMLADPSIDMGSGELAEVAVLFADALVRALEERE